jgi:glycosyltransferase involved in cell wall biosynthesis
MQIEAVGIVIPVRNGADTIGPCILSIFAANNFAGWQKALWIVVVADGCTDRTVKVAREALGAFGEVLEVAAASRRTAVRIGTNAVFDHFPRKPREAVLLASIPARACVRQDWISALLRNHELARTEAPPRAVFGRPKQSLGRRALRLEARRRGGELIPA